MKIIFSGTYDECLEQARRFVATDSAQHPIRSAYDTMVEQVSMATGLSPLVYSPSNEAGSIHENLKPIYEVKGKVYKLGKIIDVHLGSKESGFAFYKRYCSLTATADALGVKPQNISPSLQKGTVYKGIYKFFYH